ncbi:unnamed protein product [Leuciscus chuanchicus]
MHEGKLTAALLRNRSRSARGSCLYYHSSESTCISQRKTEANPHRDDTPYAHLIEYKSIRADSIFLPQRRWLTDGNILLVVVCCCGAVTPQKRAPFCLLVNSEHGSYQVSFLTHSLDALAPPLFYWSKWTSEKRVEDCIMSSDRTLVTRYLSLCREERASDNAEKLPFRFNISALLEDARLCEMNSYLNFTLLKEDVNQGQPMDSRAKSRYKRAWVLPGTLWCGRGTSANDYEQLGMFVHADRCCREHDHCEHIIRSFSVNFGVFNPTLFTVSHCDCDHRFKQCLLNGNDTISNMVGYSFFNVLKLRCFELIQRRQCTQYNWLGM